MVFSGGFLFRFCLNFDKLKISLGICGFISYLCMSLLIYKSGVAYITFHLYVLINT